MSLLKLPLRVTDAGSYSSIRDANGTRIADGDVQAELAELVRLVNSHAAQASLLTGALETIDAITSVINNGGRSSINLADVAYIIEQFREAYPSSHSQMAKDAEAKP